jgi:hypothetical protein
MWGGNAIANLTVPSLGGSGGANTQTITVSCDAPGQRTLIVGADANLTIPEENETNNNATYAISCVCPSCSFSSQQSFDAGQQNWLPYLSFDMNMTTAANTSLTALWMTNQHLDDYGQIYLNGMWVLNDSRPGPMTIPACDNFYNNGPYYFSPSPLNASYGATNFLHIDNVDYCWGSVQVDFTLGYNISVIPASGQSCSCPGSPSGLITFSPLYHRTICTQSNETGTQCPSGICSWDAPQKACISCNIFPTICTSDRDCCNNKCENFNGTGIMRCTYSPHKYASSSQACNSNYINKNTVCAPKCNTDADCPSPLVCNAYPSGTQKGCRLPCTAAAQCGRYTTACTGGFCQY